MTDTRACKTCDEISPIISGFYECKPGYYLHECKKCFNKATYLSKKAKKVPQPRKHKISIYITMWESLDNDTKNNIIKDRIDYRMNLKQLELKYKIPYNYLQKWNALYNYLPKNVEHPNVAEIIAV